ncbi:MAG: D,D-heptose 1,7-bisphosphate phosphatase [Lysobacteraceae bacterium]|nr:MAG: D,D-heptose 1,7-bisphosphate phosphatase [Xanthomonadaceae bacterium]
MRGLVILGRDGVVNEVVDGGLRAIKDWKPIPGSVEAIAKLSQGGFAVVIATNQGGLGRKALNVETLHAIDEAMLGAVQEAGGKIDAVVFAPKVARRSKTEIQSKADLFEDLIERYRVERDTVTIIGDGQEDIVSASQCGLRAILVKTGRGSTSLGFLTDVDGVTLHRDLASAAETLLARYPI